MIRAANWLPRLLILNINKAEIGPKFTIQLAKNKNLQ